MVSPERLIAGTIGVYGEERTREMYGEIIPIEESRVIVADDEAWFDLNGRAMQALHTEGHARHHYVLNDPASRGVFTGDNFGISYRELDTANGEFIFPTTTPASFDPDEAHVSVDRIMACGPEQLYLTHYSRVRDLGRLADDMHKGIDAYVEMALANKEQPDLASPIRPGCGSRARAQGRRDTPHVPQVPREHSQKDPTSSRPQPSSDAWS